MTSHELLNKVRSELQLMMYGHTAGRPSPVRELVLSGWQISPIQPQRLVEIAQLHAVCGLQVILSPIRLRT